MDTFQRRPNDEALQRGLDAVRSQGAALLEQERAEAAEREAKGYAEIRAARADAENRVVAILKQLAPLYAERSELIKSLAPALERIYSIELETRAKLNDASALVTPHWAGRIPDNQRSAKFAELRSAAGLPEFHASFGMPATRSPGERLAAVVGMGIARENITPNAVVVSGKIKQFDSSAGF